MRLPWDAGANLLCVGHGGLYWMMLPLVLRNVDNELIARQQGFDYQTLIVAEGGEAEVMLRTTPAETVRVTNAEVVPLTGKD